MAVPEAYKKELLRLISYERHRELQGYQELVGSLARRALLNTGEQTTYLEY